MKVNVDIKVKAGKISYRFKSAPDFSKEDMTALQLISEFEGFLEGLGIEEAEDDDEDEEEPEPLHAARPSRPAFVPPPEEDDDVDFGGPSHVYESDGQVVEQPQFPAQRKNKRLLRPKDPVLAEFMDSPAKEGRN